MAQRRMFSPDIVSSDAFLDMPVSSQALYFHLGMAADDDGFVNPKRVIRTVGAGDDDLKVLLAKRFLLAFEDGVVVIKHWLIHNLIRHDRYKPTQYLEHKKTLEVKENKAYTEWQPSGNQMAPQVRLGKDRLLTAKAVLTIEPEDKPRKNTKAEALPYEKALKWAEVRTGRKFINRVKQYTALKKARLVGITGPQLTERWKELESKPFHEENGLDWCMVVSSFDRK